VTLRFMSQDKTGSSFKTFNSRPSGKAVK